MNTSELKVILDNHKKWLNEDDGGIRANLFGAYLTRANLSGADLSGAYGIMSFGPIGEERRIGYGVLHTDCVMFKLGCFWGATDKAVEAIRKKYGDNSTYERMVLLAAEILEAQR